MKKPALWVRTLAKNRKKKMWRQPDRTLMALTAAQVECLLIALLSVNSFSLEKTWALLTRLRAAGLTDPQRVTGMDMPAIIDALTRSGYDRKNLTWLFAERVKALMVALHNGTLAGLEDAISSRDLEAATELLRRVRGVGPKVIESAWALLMRLPVPSTP